MFFTLNIVIGFNSIPFTRRLDKTVILVFYFLSEYCLHFVSTVVLQIIFIKRVRSSILPTWHWWIIVWFPQSNHIYLEIWNFLFEIRSLKIFAFIWICFWSNVFNSHANSGNCIAIFTITIDPNFLVIFQLRPVTNTISCPTFFKNI